MTSCAVRDLSRAAVSVPGGYGFTDNSAQNLAIFRPRSRSLAVSCARGRHQHGASGAEAAERGRGGGGEEAGRAATLRTPAVVATDAATDAVDAVETGAPSHLARSTDVNSRSIKLLLPRVCAFPSAGRPTGHEAMARGTRSAPRVGAPAARPTWSRLQSRGLSREPENVWNASTARQFANSLIGG